MSDLTIRLPYQFKPRVYQDNAMAHFDRGGKRGVYVWSRRAGKDVTFCHQAAKMAHQRRGSYFHLLPTFAHCKRAIWDAIDDQGRRIIDTAFPPQIRDGPPNETELKIKLGCGSVWMMAGADSFNALVGSNPVGIVFSEFALCDPRAWQFFRPILMQNNGWAAFISTPRGYNHLFDQLQIARREPEWDWSIVDAVDAGIMSLGDIQKEVREGMPEELARQEYLCDFSAANVGAILGRYVETAEREGRISDEWEFDDDGAGIIVSSDIGFHDTAAWWFWQAKADGFALIRYEEGSGEDAEEWIERFRDIQLPIARIYLPHDAKARTFATRHSAFEQFMRAFPGKVGVVPQSRKLDRINAARSIMGRCRFAASACKVGLNMLRNWQFKYDEERKIFSRDPEHNYASHGGDAFSYGAQMLREVVDAEAPRSPPRKQAGAHLAFSLDMCERYDGPMQYIRS